MNYYHFCSLIGVAGLMASVKMYELKHRRECFDDGTKALILSLRLVKEIVRMVTQDGVSSVMDDKVLDNARAFLHDHGVLQSATITT